MRVQLRRKMAVTALAATLSLGAAAPAFASSGGGLGSILGAVGALVGGSQVNSGSLVSANIPATSSTPAVSLSAGSTYTNNQSGLTGLLGGVLGGTYATNATLTGPNGLAASASTNGGYGLASSVQSLAAGLAGLLGGLLK